MKTACIIFILLFLAQNPAKKPDRGNAQGQNQANDAAGTLRQTEPFTVNCNQSAGTIAEHYGKETPKWYATVEWANWALVFVAGVTGWLIWIQAKETAKATKAMRDSLPLQKISADAAKTSADAFVSAERAWILVDTILPPKELYTRDHPHELMVMVFYYKFKVWGRTPTQIVESAFRFQVVNARPTVDGKRTEPDLPDAPNYGPLGTINTIPELGTVLPPGREFESRVLLESSVISLSDFQHLINRNKFLCTYGILKYRDAFDRSAIRETRFCYVYQIETGLVLTDPVDRKKVDPDAFRVGGPPAYNGVT